MSNSRLSCTVELCGTDVFTKASGLCQKHWTRRKRTGSAYVRALPIRTPGAVGPRFWAKVDRSGPVPEYAPELGPCWLWQGRTNDNGYGQFWMAGSYQSMIPAHRIALLLDGQELVEGLTVDHLCRVRSCVRPSHLEQITHQENCQRGAEARS